MFYRRKIKPDTSITGLLPALVILAIFILTLILFTIGIALKVMGALILAYSVYVVYSYILTRNPAFIIQFLYVFFLGLFALTLPSEVLKYGGRMPKISALIGFAAIFFLAWLIYLLFTRKLKWKGREVLEMAAMTVSDDQDGFTERPRPLGKVQFTRDDIRGFADFLSRNLIALPVAETNAVVFVLVSMGKEYTILRNPGRDYKEKTWVSFGNDGHVSAHMSKADYLNYRDTLSFDQLCNSLGSLYMEFFELYKKGEESRIIDRINSLNLNLMT